MSHADIYEDLLILYVCDLICPFRIKFNSAPLLLFSLASEERYTALLGGGGYHSEKHIKY
jgi:hypothetical protein